MNEHKQKDDIWNVYPRYQITRYNVTFSGESGKVWGGGVYYPLFLDTDAPFFVLKLINLQFTGSKYDFVRAGFS